MGGRRQTTEERGCRIRGVRGLLLPNQEGALTPLHVDTRLLRRLLPLTCAYVHAHAHAQLHMMHTCTCTYGHAHEDIMKTCMCAHADATEAATNATQPAVQTVFRRILGLSALIDRRVCASPPMRED